MATVSTARRRPRVRPAGSHIDATADRLSLRIPASVFTLAGFREWVKGDDFPERVRVTFISGEVYLDMSNEEPQTHVAVKGEIARALLTLVRESKLGKFYSDGVLVTNEAAEVSNNPDGTFLSASSIRQKRVRLIPRKGVEGQYNEIEGTPDLLVEVVSNSSVTKDTCKLREAYHKAGVREFWLVDARGEDIEFQILVRRKTGYATVPSEAGWQRSRVLGRSFRLDREQDEFGLWEYTLHVRE